MVERYQALIKQNGGQVHRYEDWGRRQLAYSINRVHKAHYLLFNVECDQSSIDALENSFRYNDAVLRHLILRCNSARTEPSSMLKSAEKSKGSRREPRPELVSGSDEMTDDNIR